MIVGISGKKQSGKNTVAKIWQLLFNYHSYDDTSFVRLKYKTDIEWINHILNTDAHNRCAWVQKSYAYKLKWITSILTGCDINQLEDNDFKNSKLPEEWEITRYRLNDKDGNFMTDWTFSEDEIELDYEHHSENYPELFIEKESFIPTYRWLLQNVGTDALRSIIHPDIWVTSLFSDYKPDINSVARFVEGDYITNCTKCGNRFSGSKYQNWCKTCVDKDQEPKLPKWLITDVRFPNELEAIIEREGIVIRVNRNICGKVSQNDLHPSETALDTSQRFDYIIDNSGTIEYLIEEVKKIMIKEGVINGL